jgi:hypothetical protein
LVNALHDITYGNCWSLVRSRGFNKYVIILVICMLDDETWIM